MSQIGLPFYTKAFAITKSDTVDIPEVATFGLTDGIWVGGAGNMVVIFQDGSSATFGCAAGSLVPVHAKRVDSTNTTATLMLALYQV